MKPNFALSLSQSGIELLHRNADAWPLVGRAKLEAEDFADQVALLRSTATGLDPSGLRCKLVIPDDVVKYLTIDTGMLPDSERQEAAKEALKDATPYSLDDLRFDIRADGPITHIAAVAEETLTEAESFATDHRMHPVSFVGAAAGSDFPGEPFFGHTEGAKALLEPDEAIDPDEMQTSTKSATAADVSQIIPDHQEGPDPEQDTVNFVSRRTVPTFRTGTPTDDLTEGLVGVSEGAVPGFGEPEEDFAAEVASQLNG